MEKLDVFALVDELQEEIELSPTRGIGKLKAVDPKIMGEIIDDLRKALHDELDYAHRVLAEKDKILSAAQAQADDIVSQAREKAEAMLREDPLTQEAVERSRAIMEKSRSNAAELRRNANLYADEVFQDLEDYFKESMELIRENRSRLYIKRGNGPQKEGEAPVSQ